MREIVHRELTANVEDGGRMSGGDRRRQLIRVAIKLFSQKGFRGTTTKEIALTAGVTEAIIFRHFATKDDLYAAILDQKASEFRMEERLAELKEHAARLDDETLLRSVVTGILEHHRSDVDFLRLMLYSALEGHQLARRFYENQVQPMHEFLRDYIALRQKQGAFRKCDPMTAVRAFIAMPIYHSLLTLIFCPEVPTVSEKEVIETVTSTILNGLRNKPSPNDNSCKKKR